MKKTWKTVISKCILKQKFKCDVGYSGHESTVSPTIFAYLLGANYIERHIQEYPDIPIVAPQEIQEKINSPFVSHVDTDTVESVTSENFDKILNQYSSVELAAGATAAGVMSHVVRLTPFLVAYYRNKITRDELGIVIQKFFPDISMTD